MKKTMTSMSNQVERHNKTITMMSSHVTKELNHLSRRISEPGVTGKINCIYIQRLETRTKSERDLSGERLQL